MRTRLLALLVACALTATLSGTAAGAAGREIGGPSLPDQAPQTARERAEAALDRAQALFADKSPAAARRPLARTGREATLVLNEVMRTRGDLSPADRKRAEALLARPTDPGGDVLEDGFVAEYEVEEEPPYCGATICIHYVASTDDAPVMTDGNGNGVPDTVEQALATAESVHDAYVSAGYRRPDGDGTLGGGSDLVDIYLADIGPYFYGYCASDEPETTGKWNAWAYCVIDDDFARAQFPTNTPTENQQVTLAHEYFHAVQYAYDSYEDYWFLEATATWAEDELFDDVNDNRQYLPDGHLLRPGSPLDRYDESQSPPHYGNWIFFRYLTERWPARTGGMPKLMLQLMKTVSARSGDGPDRYSTDAIRRVLAKRGTSFTKVYGQFADANRRPGRAYDEGKAYPKAKPARTYRLGRSRRKAAASTRLDHLTNRTVRFKPGKGTGQKSWRLRVKVDAPARKTAPVARMLVFQKNGKVTSRAVKLNKKGKGATVVPFSSRKVTRVELVVGNASLRTRCPSKGFAYGLPYFACFGNPRDDGRRSDIRATIFRR